MKNLTLILSLFVFLSGCNKNDTDKQYPKCLQGKIDNYFLDVSSPPSLRATIKKYSYQERVVYAFNTGNIVEGWTTIFNENCEIICEFGGIGGSGATTCENWGNAVFIETVWEDPR